MEPYKAKRTGSSEEWQEIRYVQRLLADIYTSDVYKSLGLFTLELTRRFSKSLVLFEKNGDREHFQKLLISTDKLVKRLEKGHF